MIRIAVVGEGGLVYERLVAEIEREGFDLLAPGPGGIEREIEQGQQWYIDDDDPTVIAHALLGKVKDPDTREEIACVLVPHVWNKSERDEEVLRFLANDLLARYGDMPVAYPQSTGPRVAKADAIVSPRLSNGTRLTTLGDAARILNGRVRGISPK